MADPLGGIGRFLRELKRRKVYRVAVTYIIVAAGSIELVDILVPTTRLPPWSDELFLGLAVLGFPLAVVLAWAWDVTPEGVRRTAYRVPEEEATGPDGGTAGGADSGTAPGDDTYPTAAESAPEAPVPPDAATSGPPTDSREPELPALDVLAVAVLPFDNLSGTEEAEPFAAGLHDDLLTELSRLSALTVISRTSLMAYRDTEKTVREIARELGAGTVVEGGVQQAGRRVRLRVQLIDARTDAHRWAERYDRELTPENIFEIQTELAREIAGILRAELTPEEKRRIGRRRAPTRDLEAYRLHVEGREGLNQRTEADIHRAIRLFREAVARDPSYAPAWAGLAEGALLLRFYDYTVPEHAPDPEVAAERAIELDPDDAEAHASLGILHSLRREGPAALRELRRAVELRPSYGDAHAWLGWVHLMTGQPREALGPARRAAELDPVAPAARVYLAEALLADGKGREALREATRARRIQPEYGLGHFMRGLALHHLECPADAVEALEEALSLARPGGSPSRAEVRAALAATLATAGDRSGARQHLAALERAADPFSLGLARAALGEEDAAFEAFRRVREWGSFETEHLRYFFPRALGPLRQDPRWEALIRDVDGQWGRDRDGGLPAAGG